MGKAFAPQRLVVGDCPTACSLNANKLDEHAEAIHSFIEAGKTVHQIVELAAGLGVELSWSAVRRHRSGHLRPFEPSDAADEALIAGSGMSLIETVDLALRLGARNVRNWKLTPQDYIRFAEIKIKLDGGEGNRYLLELFDGPDAAEALAEAEEHAALDRELSQDDLTPEDEGYQ